MKDKRSKHGEIYARSGIDHTKARNVTAIIQQTTSNSLNNIQKSKEKYVQVK